MPSHEILLEIRRIGTTLRVSAVDAESGTEVVFQAPSSTNHAALHKLAVSKLQYVMKKGSGNTGA